MLDTVIPRIVLTTEKKAINEGLLTFFNMFVWFLITIIKYFHKQ